MFGVFDRVEESLINDSLACGRDRRQQVRGGFNVRPGNGLAPRRSPMLSRGVYGHRENVVAGGLLSYTSNFAANFRHSATFVDRILKGAKPADLPVEQPTRFQLVINLKTAKALGLKIPYSVMLRIDEVIE